MVQTNGDLLDGPGHLRTTPLPGAIGTSVVMGRSTTYGAPFRKITTLRPGDPITVLGAQGTVTYIVKDEAIQITSLQKAKETLSTRAYYIGDLIGFGGGMQFGGGLAQLQMARQLQQLAVLITQTVEPESWMIADKGGLGTIAFDPITMSFVVRQTAEIHFMMGIGMR